MSGSHTIYLLLGGNLGNVEETFERVSVLIEKKIGKIEKKSSIYWSEPWGFAAKNNFLNRVLKVCTPLQPEELLKCLLQIEIDLGRDRNTCTDEYLSRAIDIDILFYDSIDYQSETLTVPHPKIQERMFTLLPLEEVAPDYNHPVLNKTISNLTRNCKDPVAVWKK